MHFLLQVPVNRVLPPNTVPVDTHRFRCILRFKLPLFSISQASVMCVKCQRSHSAVALHFGSLYCISCLQSDWRWLIVWRNVFLTQALRCSWCSGGRWWKAGWWVELVLGTFLSKCEYLIKKMHWNIMETKDALIYSQWNLKNEYFYSSRMH